MNKPEPIRFEYEKLFDKNGTHLAYRIEACQMKHNYLESYLGIGATGYGKFYVDFSGYIDKDNFGIFKNAVELYNARYCECSVKDVKILDEFNYWLASPENGISTKEWKDIFGGIEEFEKFKDAVRRFKDMLKSDYFVEKE